MSPRNRLNGWLVLFCVLAVFAAEPRGSLSFVAKAFDVIGEFGGTLIVEVMSDDDTGPAAVWMGGKVGS